MQAAAYDEETNLVTLISETPCRNAAVAGFAQYGGAAVGGA